MEVSGNDIGEARPLWIQHAGKWRGRVYDLYSRAVIVHENLMKDIE
jgi:hypothetical protein